MQKTLEELSAQAEIEEIRRPFYHSTIKVPVEQYFEAHHLFLEKIDHEPATHEKIDQWYVWANFMFWKQKDELKPSAWNNFVGSYCSSLILFQIDVSASSLTIFEMLIWLFLERGKDPLDEIPVDEVDLPCHGMFC